MNTLSQGLARLRHEELLAAARRERPARRLARALRAERRADRAAARAAKAASVARLRLARAL